MFRFSLTRLTLPPTPLNSKTVIFGGEARERMLFGIERIAKAVGVTLGPKGRNVIIRHAATGEPKITKDGVTVARSIEFLDQFEDIGARLIRQVAGKTNDVAGDGTTTATILAWSIFNEGYKCVATGANPMDLKRGIDFAVEQLIESLTEQRRPVKDHDTLENVATISANGERHLGKLIASAVQAVGMDGNIAVVDGTSGVTTWEKHEGWSIEHGFVSSQLVTDTEHLRSELQNVLVFITPEDLVELDDVLPLLDAAASAKRPLTIVARSFSEPVLQAIIANHTAGVVRCVLAALPEPPLAIFEDVAITCSCMPHKVVTIRTVTDVKTLFGSARRVQQTMDSTIVDGLADTTDRVRLLQGKLSRTLEEADREDLKKRIATLTRSFAVIRVSGRSAIEISEQKDRVVDALNAARNALQDGIVAGGGSALMHATRRLDAILHEDDEMEQDRRMGIFIVRNAARLPMRIIGDNAGVEGPVVVGNCEELEDTAMGYDAQNDKYVDMFEAGIVDPLMVVTSCVNDAASVAGLMITTEASVCDHEEPRPVKL